MELALDQALQKGVEAHKAGKVQEADLYYTAILKANPKHPDANHNMGVLSVGVGKTEAALPFFKTALDVNPNITPYWLNYIDALLRLNRINEAKTAFDQAKSNGVKGDSFDELEEKLNLTAANKSIKQDLDLPQDKLQELIGLYTQKKFQEVFEEADTLTKSYTKSFSLWNLMGAAGAQIGQLDEAICAFQKALSIKPDYAEAYYNIGLALKKQGKPDEELEAYRNVLSIEPDYADAYYRMGNALHEQGKIQEAIEAYLNVLSIKPDCADAYYNLGNVLHAQGKMQEAIKAYKNALSIKPDYAEVYNNMGIALHAQGKIQEAVKAYENALSVKLDYAEAFYNMGLAHQEEGKQYGALEAYNKALLIKPDYAEAYNNMGLALKGITFTTPNRDLQKTIVSLLDKKRYVRPKHIAKAAISLLKLEPTLQKYLKLVDTEVTESPLDVISDLSNFPLFLKLMSVCPLPDLEFEQLLKRLRQAILSNVLDEKDIPPELCQFQSALALQCFTNEYIYSHTEEEEKTLHSLEASVKRAFKNNEQPSPQVILILASYKPLNEYDWCKLLIVTDHIKELFIRQVEDTNKEEILKQGLLILEEITDSVSVEVRAQYEESPYPRWINLGLPLKPMSISKVVDELKLKLHDNKITEVEKPEILIAGCGTGQHSIGTATRFKSSNVLAIDLSLSSLAYAKRKTEEFAIKNIEYMQADILNLNKLSKKFDIIESGGVLHHMDDPMAGWKVLTECLKPGGLMKIGLYSELARQHIVKTRKEISKASIGSSHPAMKSFRDFIIKSNEDHHKLITRSADFYSLSTLKDLLFHVQEHRFTIPQIKGYLDKLGLKFCGFEWNEIVSHFKQTNNAKEDLYDLDKWQAYEQANPDVFVGMYQFWCQKVD